MVSYRKDVSPQDPVLVIVTGLPCSGKTTLARQVASQLALPLITKDGIKETLFDNLGWKDREWSQKLSRATYALMYLSAEEFLSKNISLLVESNFIPGQADRTLREIQSRVPFRPVQVNCYAEGQVLIERFKNRAGARHPGHVDSQTLAEILPGLQTGRLPPLDLGGVLIDVDTTDFSRVNTAEIITQISRAFRQ